MDYSGFTLLVVAFMTTGLLVVDAGYKYTYQVMVVCGAIAAVDCISHSSSLPFVSVFFWVNWNPPT